MEARRRNAVIAGAVLLLATSSWFAIRRLSGPARTPGTNGGSASARAQLPPAAPTIGPRDHPPTPPATAQPAPAAAADSARRNDPEARKRRMEMGEQALQAYLKYAQYPPQSRPPSETVPPTFSASAGETRREFTDLKPTVKQNQDHFYVTGGVKASAELTVFVGDAPVEIDPPTADVTKVTPEGPGDVVATAVFKDDGVPPDRTARDKTYTALVPFAPEKLGDFAGRLQMGPIVSAAGDRVPVDFGFIATGKPPARFTGAVDEQLRDGSLELSFGVDVESAGLYALTALAKDASGNPIARMEWMSQLEPGSTKAKLVVFGKLVRDASAPSPFVVDSIEGWRIGTGDTEVARRVMRPFDGPYRTRRYPLSAFSDAEWESPEKDTRIQDLRAEAEGL
jgi:hypothetical protein